MYDTLIFCGGAEKVLATLGVLGELPEEVWRACRTVVGTSAGAMLALLVASRMPYARCVEVIRQHFCGAGDDDNSNDAAAHDLSLWEGGLGALDGRRCVVGNFVRAVLFETMGVVNCTLGEFVRCTGVDLLVPVCNVSDERTDILSVQDTPDIDMVTAMCMSTCVPFLFQPLEYNGRLYVDGATYGEIMQPDKFAACSKLQPHRVLLVYLESRTVACSESPMGLLDFSLRLLRGVLRRGNDELLHAARSDPRVTCISVPLVGGMVHKLHQGRPLLSVSESEMEQLMSAGRDAARAHAQAVHVSGA